MAALEELVEAKLALGRHAEVVGELEALIGEHPYRERLRAQLMLALYRCDRQADALQAYQDARAGWSTELGIEPGERLRELEQAILAQDPALAAHAERSPPAAPVTPSARRPPHPAARRAPAGEHRRLARGVDRLAERLDPESMHACSTARRPAAR